MIKRDTFQGGGIYSADGSFAYVLISLIQIHFTRYILNFFFLKICHLCALLWLVELTQSVRLPGRGDSLIITVRMWRSSQIEMSSPAFCLDGFTLLSLAHGACLTSPLTHSLQASPTLSASGFPASGAITVCQSQGSYDHKVVCHTVHHLYSSLFVLFL